jgi:hypothetical protein
MRESNLAVPAIVVLIGTVVCVAGAGAEIITNGGFETGNLAGWRTFAALGGSGGGPGIRTSGYSGQPPQEGNYLVEIYENSSNMNGNGGGLEQDIHVLAGRDFTLSFYLNSVNSDTRLTASVLDAGGSPLVAQEYDAISGSWILHEINFTSTTPNLTVRFQETSDNSSSRDPLLDSIQVTPEPGAAMLLVVAGLLAVGRRGFRGIRAGHSSQTV